MLNLLTRWTRSRPFVPTAPAPGTRPPDSLLQSLLRWLPGENTPWHARAEDPALLPLLRREFERCLGGVDAPEELVRSIQRARRVDDFWHLRGWLYTEVARAHDQREAEMRLAGLNRHFTDPIDTFFMMGPVRRQ
jgi:hypothetical protein